jgi:hypothetical protein
MTLKSATEQIQENGNLFKNIQYTKILLSYIRKFLRKKIIKLEKINFIANKNKSKTVLVST